MRLAVLSDGLPRKLAPAEGQWVVIHVAGAAAIELDQVGHEHGLVGTGVGNRLGVLGGYSDGIGIAGVQAVADRKLDFIRSGLIDEEAGIDGGRRVEAGTTAAGQAEHGPLIRQRIAIGVAGTTPVELDGVGDKDGLVWAGMGERLGVEGLDKDGIRVARFTAIGDDELEFVGADQVGGEAWLPLLFPVAEVGSLKVAVLPTGTLTKLH